MLFLSEDRVKTVSRQALTALDKQIEKERAERLQVALEIQRERKGR